MSSRSCSPSPVPPPPEDPPDPGPELEASGTGPLVAALDGMQTCLKRLAGADRPPCPGRGEVQRVFGDLADGTRTHLLKEDVMFYPALRHLAAGRPAQVPLGLHLQGPVELLREEHAVLLGTLEECFALLEGVGTGLSRPDRQALQAHAAALGRALQTHVRLQEEHLFPRVLAGAEWVP